MRKRGTVLTTQCLQNLMFVLSKETHDSLTSCEMFLWNEAAVIQTATLWASDPRGLLAKMRPEDVLLCKILQKGSLLVKINLEMLSTKDFANMT